MQTPNQPARIYSRDPYVHGSSQWASRAHLKSRHYGETGRMFLGYGLPEHSKAKSYQIRSSSKMHHLSVGATRSGKGISSGVPTCLEYDGPVGVLDVKDGENASVCARYRRDVMGRNVVLIDPEDIVASTLGMKNYAFNPVGDLDPKSDDFFDQAFLIADSLVMDNPKDPFWSDEAKALITGFCMYARTAAKPLLPAPEKGRTLGQVRAMLNLSPKAFINLIAGEFEKDEEGNATLITLGMAQSRNEHVRSAAGRIMNKNSKERASVISTAQSNTHFLESPKIQRILSKSEFNPAVLEEGNTDVFIIMSTAKIASNNRLLRLFVNWTISAISRFKKKPDPPILLLLEEMGTALGRLSMVETAFGLMAGYGMILKGFLQDFNQLKSLYNDNWETIIANCGVIQCCGVNDVFTCDYLSKLCGTTTIEFVSEASAGYRAGIASDPNYYSRDDQVISRPLITPSEIRVMHPASQLLILANAHPVTAFKTAYFLDNRYRDKQGKPLFDIHPDYRDKPLSRPVDFTRAGLDIGAVLDPVFNGA